MRMLFVFIFNTLIFYHNIFVESVYHIHLRLTTPLQSIRLDSFDPIRLTGFIIIVVVVVVVVIVVVVVALRHIFL